MKNSFKLVVIAFFCFLASCGGGSDGETSQPATLNTIKFKGMVIDDYVINAKVEFIDLNTKKLIGQTKTGALGEINFDLPSNSNYLVRVTEGVIDADGDPATTKDQQPFSGTIKGMAIPEFQSRLQILGSATTGIVNYVGSDASKYREAVLKMDQVFPVFAKSMDASDPNVQAVLSAQQSLGFSRLIDEVSDDGQINGSLNVTKERVLEVKNSALRAAKLAIKDPRLFVCLEESLRKQEPSIKDLEKITELVCENRYINSLDGIEALSNLKSLVIRGNTIGSFAPLSNIRGLEYIDAASNRIFSLSGIENNTYAGIVDVNIEDNCISTQKTVKNVNFLYLSRQKSDCSKTVRDPVLFNAYRVNKDSFLVSYRIPASDRCDIEYSSGNNHALMCDGKVHRFNATVPWSGDEEYVRLNISGKSYAFYKIAIRFPLVSSVSPASAHINKPVNISVTGKNLPVTSIIAVDDGTCQPAFDIKPNGTGFTQTCTVAGAAGNKAITIKTNTAANGGVVIDASRYLTVGAADIAASKLPATGVTVNQCYKAGSNDLVACNSPEAIALSGAGKQDGMLAHINPMSYSLVPKADGGFYDKTECVKDNVTGLIWEGKTADGGLRDKSKIYTNSDDPNQPQKYNISTNTWTNPTQAEIDATTNVVGYVKAVNATGLCGASDWRLPTLDELQSIVDYGKPYPGPALNTDWFLNTMNDRYWSSPTVGHTGFAWFVGFTDGHIDYTYRNIGYDHLNAVRLVRASQ